MDYACILHHAGLWTKLVADDSFVYGAGTTQSALVGGSADSHASTGACTGCTRAESDSFVQHPQWPNTNSCNDSADDCGAARTIYRVFAGCQQSRSGGRNRHGPTWRVGLGRVFDGCGPATTASRAHASTPNLFFVGGQSAAPGAAHLSAARPPSAGSGPGRVARDYQQKRDD